MHLSQSSVSNKKSFVPIGQTEPRKTFINNIFRRSDNKTLGAPTNIVPKTLSPAVTPVPYLISKPINTPSLNSHSSARNAPITIKPNVDLARPPPPMSTTIRLLNPNTPPKIPLKNTKKSFSTSLTSLRPSIYPTKPLSTQLPTNALYKTNDIANRVELHVTNALQQMLKITHMIPTDVIDPDLKEEQELKLIANWRNLDSIITNAVQSSNNGQKVIQDVGRQNRLLQEQVDKQSLKILQLQQQVRQMGDNLCIVTDKYHSNKIELEKEIKFLREQCEYIRNNHKKKIMELYEDIDQMQIQIAKHMEFNKHNCRCQNMTTISEP
ncbi:type I cytoskeletal keratin [Acrasis kona]|uniref:Type I cytoskeletal keratin n=1 Tax=Acrasis kona TaxID=1008807 RepID=A0AAW2YNL9_9EUKA